MKNRCIIYIYIYIYMIYYKIYKCYINGMIINESSNTIRYSIILTREYVSSNHQDLFNNYFAIVNLWYLRPRKTNTTMKIFAHMQDGSVPWNEIVNNLKMAKCWDIWIYEMCKWSIKETLCKWRILHLIVRLVVCRVSVKFC